jgi:hypothetical protein
MKENSILRAQLDDTQMTLRLNKELLYKHVSDINPSIVNELKVENTRLTENIQKLYKDKIDLEKKVKIYNVSYIKHNKLLMIEF